VTPERWRRVREIVDAALDAPAAERSARVEAACGGDAALAAEARSLLAAEPEADTVTCALRAAVEAEWQSVGRAAPPEPAGEDAAGQRIGAYTLERELGRGGMGVVYLGRRADRSYDGRVAIKLLRCAEDQGGELVRRFRQERQILARLDHPNIARLLDAGATPAGQLYLVMEHVEGTEIDAWCDENRLGIEARLRLFLRVAEAVQAAHRSLVVHRDLKPANVLVTSAGVPKLLDFGIAKILDPSGFPHAADTTFLGLQPMTPAHAAPEQIEGAPVTTATDVYGLGVTLYRLLTGALPYPDDRPLHRAIVETEPIPASARMTERGAAEIAAARGTDPARLRRRLGGDLDTILATALAKEPERRYGSAEAFAADVDRHLRGLPVAARRPTLRYRLAKAARRNRLAAGLAAVLTLAVVGFGASMGVLAGRLAEERDRVAAERDRALREEREARQTADFLRELFSSPDPSRAMGEELTARELLDRGAERLERELAGDPEALASLLDSIARAYEGLGLPDRAGPLFERSLALRRRVLGDDHPETLESALHRGRNLHQLGDFGAAREKLREALGGMTRALGPGSPAVAEALEGLADLDRVTGRLAAAETGLERALVIRRRAGDPADRAETLLGLGLVRTQLGRHGEAESLYREAHETLLRVRGADHPTTLQAQKALAASLREAGRFAEAEAAFRRLLEAERRVLGTSHPRIPYTLAGLGYSLADQGRPEEAEGYFREALRIRRETLGDDHPAIPVSLTAVATALRQQGRSREAEALYREAVERVRRAFPPGFPGLAYPLVELGTLLTADGRAAEAEPLLREAAELRRRALGPDDELSRKAEAALSACRAALGPTAEP
jgi:eukaryotic-like serine/threonine-protein kinase